MLPPAPLEIGTRPLTPQDVVVVARNDVPVTLSAEALGEIAASRKVVEALADDAERHYGVSTGFGALAVRHIPVSCVPTLPGTAPRSSGR